MRRGSRSASSALPYLSTWCPVESRIARPQPLQVSCDPKSRTNNNIILLTTTVLPMCTYLLKLNTFFSTCVSSSAHCSLVYTSAIICHTELRSYV